MTDLITTHDAAALLNLSPIRVRTLIRTGRIKARRVGPIYLLSRADVDAYKPLPQGWRKGRKRGPKRPVTPPGP